MRFCIAFSFAQTHSHLYDRIDPQEQTIMNVIAQAQFKTALRRYEMTEAERAIRIEAAAAFRMAHHFRWNLGINNHICVRLPDRPDHFLMNPFGLGWDEITASNLATVKQGGEI